MLTLLVKGTEEVLFFVIRLLSYCHSYLVVIIFGGLRLRPPANLRTSDRGGDRPASQTRHERQVVGREMLRCHVMANRKKHTIHTIKRV